MISAKDRDTATMIGRDYTFFLSNESLGESYYSYQFFSPGLSEYGIPTFSLTKITERFNKLNWGTNNKEEAVPFPSGNDGDILQFLLGPKKYKKQYTDYLKTILKREGLSIYHNGKGFPHVEMVFGEKNSLQKSVIIHLRDSLRWKVYRFLPGLKIDLLYSPTEFVVFEFKETADHELYVEPVAAYKNFDVEMKKPIKVDLNNLAYPKGTWSKDKFSDMNRVFKSFEWESFTRKELIPTSKKR